jgi:D-alanyl-lipoteichoic acid acyltransferase DltB (MBOAT superfamily)
MLFNSVIFLVFFCVVVATHFALPARKRWVALLASSYFFYMWWRPEYALLIVTSTLIDYFVALRIGATEDERHRRWLLWVSLAANLGLLISFKYFNFLGRSLRDVLGFFGSNVEVPVLDVLLPIGISFYTFQTLSYTIDVWRRKTEPERHLGRFALYVAFWPQLVAGPIERSTRLLPQLTRRMDFDYDRVRSGLVRMAWGFFKKLVVADRLAPFVDEAYGNAGAYGGGVTVMATVCFALQIYCDFSGYSDIAIGAARVLGIDLMENFRSPYFARSVGEFWQRWHISLSTWFRDYVYIPLGGNRRGGAVWFRNLLITFLVSGLWHGASWTFAVWGLLHGGYVALEAFLGWRGAPRTRWGGALRWAVTMAAVLFAWIFFRARTFEDAGRLVASLGNIGDPRLWIRAAGGRISFALGVGAALLLVAAEALLRDRTIESVVCAWRTPLRWCFYVGLVLVTLWFGVFARTEFIYFQF